MMNMRFLLPHYKHMPESLRVFYHGVTLACGVVLAASLKKSLISLITHDYRVFAGQLLYLLSLSVCQDFLSDLKKVLLIDYFL